MNSHCKAMLYSNNNWRLSKMKNFHSPPIGCPGVYMGEKIDVKRKNNWVWNVKYLHIPQNIAIFASGMIGVLRLYLFDIHIYIRIV